PPRSTLFPYTTLFRSHDARAIIVTVQLLAAMPGERDEVRRGEHEIVLRHGDLELFMGGHATLLPAAPRKWPRRSGPPWRRGSACWPRPGAHDRARRWHPVPPSSGPLRH